MSEYDDLMKAAKQKLEFEQNGTLSQEQPTQEDIYASIKEEVNDTENQTQSIPNINRTIDYNNKPDINPEKNQYDKEDDYYIDPNDAPIFTGGPGISKVQLWKKQYGVSKIYHTKILERHFLFRTLNRAEYEQIASLALDSLTNEELICKTCVLWPYNYDYAAMGKDDAGYPGTLAQIIMENSGFTNDYGIEVL